MSKLLLFLTFQKNAKIYWKKHWLFFDSMPFCCLIHNAHLGKSPIVCKILHLNITHSKIILTNFFISCLRRLSSFGTKKVRPIIFCNRIVCISLEKNYETSFNSLSDLFEWGTWTLRPSELPPGKIREIILYHLILLPSDSSTILPAPF
jgi:hypothetical protein